jgi:NADH:ubiquinone oxidoreductase subunit D
METTRGCSLKKLVPQNLVIKKWKVQAFVLKKEEIINFCSLKKLTLQTFVKKNASVKKLVLQNFVLKKRTVKTFVMKKEEIMNFVVPKSEHYKVL